MKILFPFSIIIVLALFCSSCIKKECRLAGFPEFELPVTLSPALDTFKIGDTMSISSIFEDVVYERESEQWYRLENINFFPETAVFRIDTLDVLDSFSEFDVIIPDQYDYYLFQYPSSGRKALIGEYNYENNTYSLEYQLVPKKKGLYCFGQWSSLSVLGEGQEFEGQCCKKKIIYTYCKVNDGGDNNVEFLEYSPDPDYNTWTLQEPEERFHSLGGYCFYVTE